ncbi:MAG TPA: hypothetical protein ENJ37_08760 [Deltaproteobacteria bacterium]|nr:hypothetical protein [Deltaproteobacteria bacterium]
MTVLAALVVSCGDQTGGGGGGGSGSSGIIFSVDKVVPRDLVSLADSWSVDMVWNTDCNGDGTADDPELFGAHGADITLTAKHMDGVTVPPAARFLTITHYTVEYSIVTGYTGPSFPTRTYYESLMIELQTGLRGNATMSVKLMPEDLKRTYVPALGGSQTWTYGYPEYNVVYTFYAQDEYGNDLMTKAFAVVTLGNFNACSGQGGTGT